MLDMSGIDHAAAFSSLSTAKRVGLAKVAFTSLLKRPPYKGDARARGLNRQIGLIAAEIVRTNRMGEEFCALYDSVAPQSQRKSILELQQIMDDFQSRLSLG